jgi:5-methylcytosine-specific restriction endonuclease McrA
MAILKVCVHPGCRATYVPQRGVRRCPPHEADYIAQRNAVRKTRGKTTYDSPAFRKARKHLRDTIGYCVGPGPHSGTLDVHHVDGNAANNVMTNLRLLCRSCHARADAGRRRNQQSSPQVNDATRV